MSPWKIFVPPRTWCMKVKCKQNTANLFVPTQSEYPVLDPLRLPVRQEFSPFIVSTAILTLCLKFSHTTLRVYKRQVFPTQSQDRGRGNRHRLVQWPANTFVFIYEHVNSAYFPTSTSVNIRCFIPAIPKFCQILQPDQAWTYLIFVIFLHWQNFWRIKFTPKNANFSR